MATMQKIEDNKKVDPNVGEICDSRDICILVFEKLEPILLTRRLVRGYKLN
jgi:hypothetical protein